MFCCLKEKLHTINYIQTYQLP